MPEKKPCAIDIFDLLSESGEKATEKEAPSKTQRQELLAATRVKDVYPEGTITIDKRTCVGGQCKYCIKACPTNALYWTNSGVGIVQDLCVHCEACVLCCMVEDCIKVTRKREDGKIEKFSTVREVLALINKENVQKRLQRACGILPSAEEYCKRYCSKE